MAIFFYEISKKFSSILHLVRKNELSLRNANKKSTTYIYLLRFYQFNQEKCKIPKILYFEDNLKRTVSN